MMEQFYFWECIWRKLNHDIEEIFELKSCCTRNIYRNIPRRPGTCKGGEKMEATHMLSSDVI